MSHTHLNDHERAGVNWAASLAGRLSTEPDGSARLDDADATVKLLSDDSLVAAEDFTHLCLQELDELLDPTLLSRDARYRYRQTRVAALLGTLDVIGAEIGARSCILSEF